MSKTMFNHEKAPRHDVIAYHRLPDDWEEPNSVSHDRSEEVWDAHFARHKIEDIVERESRAVHTGTTGDPAMDRLVDSVLGTTGTESAIATPEGAVAPDVQLLAHDVEITFIGSQRTIPVRHS
jgi:hypothetical protein